MDADNVETTEVVKTPAKRGRPKKSDIQANIKRGGGKGGKIGRPAGDNQRMQELKGRLLATSGSKMIDKVIQIAMNDEHQGQMAALKMCMDRVLPVHLFNEQGGSGSKPTITINIAGLSESISVSSSSDNYIEDVEEGEYEEL